MKKEVFGFDCRGERGINTPNDFAVGVDENGNVAMKLGEKEVNEKDLTGKLYCHTYSFSSINIEEEETYSSFQFSVISKVKEAMSDSEIKDFLSTNRQAVFGEVENKEANSAEYSIVYFVSFDKDENKFALNAQFQKSVPITAEGNTKYFTPISAIAHTYYEIK